MSVVSWSCKAQTCYDTSTLTKPTIIDNIIGVFTFGAYNQVLRDKYSKTLNEQFERTYDANNTATFTPVHV